MQPPIAEPIEVSHFSGDEIQSFRIKFWPYALLNYAAVIVSVAIILWLRNVLTNGRFPLPTWERSLALLIIGAILMALMTGFIWRKMPFATSKWGLRAPTIWGTTQEIAWAQIVGVRYSWLLYPFLIVSNSRGSKLWLPFGLQNPREFAQSVAAHTAPDHPLHAFLRQRGLLN